MHAITLHSEYVLSVVNIHITNSFLTTIIVTIFLSMIAMLYSANASGGFILFRAIEYVLYTILKTIDGVTKDRNISKLVLPFIATFFIGIVTANLMGLLPGFLGAFYISLEGHRVPLLRSPNSDLTTTAALACISVMLSQYFSIKLGGWNKYIKRYFNVSNPLTAFIGFTELISEAAKLLSFSFRLFGNIFAGEVLLLITGFLIPYILPIPFMIIEVFVGFIQAYIFALLTLNFITNRS